MGKSRLLQEFLTHLPGHPLIAIGAGHEAERGLPHWPLIEALRPHVASIAQTVGEAEASQLAEMTCLWPELRSAASTSLQNPRLNRARNRAGCSLHWCTA